MNHMNRVGVSRRFVIGDRVVTQDSVGYVIAEIGHNHQGNMDTCKAMLPW